MIDVLRAAWTRLRSARVSLFSVVVVAALAVSAVAFVAGLGVGAVAIPLHEHMLRASDTRFYPISTERGPSVGAGTMALLTAVMFTLALGLLFLCVWTAITVVLASALARRRTE